MTNYEKIGHTTNNPKNFDDLVTKLEEYIKTVEMNSKKSEKNYISNDYKEIYAVYKKFFREMISSFPESEKLFNKFITDFDGIINNVSINFQNLTEKLENSKKKYSSKNISLSKF